MTDNRPRPAEDELQEISFAGVDANVLLPSILANGIDPATLHRSGAAEVDIGGGGPNARAWRDIWSAGQGIGAVRRTEPAADVLDWLAADYARARRAMGLAA